MNRRLAIGGAVVIVLLIALIAILASGGDEAEPEAASTTPTQPAAVATTLTTATTRASTTTQPDTSTTEPPSTTTSTPSDPALPDTSGDDYESILRELIDYHNWAHQNPAEADPTVYLDPACECFAQVDERLTEWAASGWRETDEGIVVSEVLVLFEASNSIRMRMVDEHVPLTVVDVDGNVVETREARGPTRNSITIVRNAADTGWVINEWILQGPAGG